MYANIAGVRTDPDKPGFRGIILQPRPGGGLSYARAIFQSPYGLVLSHWTKEDGSFIWDVTIPPNATATAYIPAWPDSRILEAGAPAGGSPGVMFLRRTSDAEVYELASGSYRFEVVNGNL
jgi:alpha-L-rhamnosidase